MPGRSDAPVPEGTINELGRNSRRRLLIRILSEEDREVTLHDLATEIAMRETETNITDLPEEKLKHITIALQHKHLPRLEDEGVVTYDEDRGHVKPIDGIDHIEDYFDEVAEGSE